MDITINAHAKINLVLDVIGKRADGYHELRTVMQAVGLHDQLTLRASGEHLLKLVCDNPSLPVGNGNLVYEAAKYCQDVFSLPGGLLIELKKRIPISAGLAGGSSDCAATLLGINRMYGLGLPLQELIGVGAKFGADVPFCLLGGTALAEGIGGLLTPLPPHPPVTVVIAKPPMQLSTAAVFHAFDSTQHEEWPNIGRVAASLKERDINGVVSSFRNALEKISARMCPDILRAKALLIGSGAMGALMSGSGPSVFAYFEDAGKAEQAMRAVVSAMPNAEVFLTGTFNKGETVS